MSLDREDAYSLAGTTIKRPSAFKIERYKITNASRLANGNMTADVLARKRTFNLTYNQIKASELNKILDAVWNNMSYFFSFTYVDNGVAQSATVYPGSIPAELYCPIGDWTWKNVSFSLIEQ
jgi:hypothetical protein